LAIESPERTPASRSAAPRIARAARRLGGWAALLAPGAILVFLSFQGGGFFPTAPAVVAVVLAVALTLRVTLVARPFAGFNGLVGAIAIALALLAAWTLGSALWSDAPGRAILEFDRALLYLLTFALFASAPMARARLAWTIGAVLAGIVVVCGAGFVTRTLPELWPIAPNLLNQRLSYPVTYWNALGLLAAIGTILAVHVTASEREPRRAQVLAAAAVPLLTSTLLLTSLAVRTRWASWACSPTWCSGARARCSVPCWRSCRPPCSPCS
jgi:hypothetical protein